jgi:hypothetical protein
VSGSPTRPAARRPRHWGCVPGELTLTGAYEILGPGHHSVMWAYRSSTIATIPGRFTGQHLTAVRQLPWERQTRIPPTCQS